MSAYLRHMEYYGMTEILDSLYKKSGEGESFNRLYELINSRENILLAYRSIKSNDGSKTAGVDGKTIKYFEKFSEEQLIEYIRNSLVNYKPNSVRRQLIPKENGDFRPLGIPTMRDRIIQKMFKQILEPICEAKFYKHSYGFRPLRKASHAKARIEALINVSGLHYCVDVDIKSYFDNVDHTLLIKKMWNIGIRDKKVLAIVSKMLKAPIKGVGTPTKGTQQGGVLSPLLSNIYLHELDMWVASQWENFKARSEGFNRDNRHKYRRLKVASNLKEGFIVRYADDFKILTRDVKQAYKWFHAIKDFLKHRLKLDISPEKSKVINLRRRYSEFLGFEIKARIKGDKRTATSKVRKKKLTKIKQEARKKIDFIYQLPNTENLDKWNSFVLGLQNYFCVATRISDDFGEVKEQIYKRMYHKFKDIGTFELPKSPSHTYRKFYGMYNYKTWNIKGKYLFPIQAIKNQVNLGFTPTNTIYSVEGRRKVTKELEGSIIAEIHRLLAKPLSAQTIEYNDNRLSRYSMKKGKCEVTGVFLYAEDVHCHHKLPKILGGTDDFDNLRIVHKLVHKLVHAKKEEVINKYLDILNLDNKAIKRLNPLRKMCNLAPISEV